VAYTRAQIEQAFTAANGRPPHPDEVAEIERRAGAGTTASSGWLEKVRAKAAEYVGTPYKWAGTTKEGIDCSAFLSTIWGVARQTTDTLLNIAKPVGRDALEPGDALNLTTGQDPRGYGHVRMFDGWADEQHKTMYVYESSTATGGVVRRVIADDQAYTPMRLSTRVNPQERAATVGQATASVGATTPSRDGTPGQPAAIPTTVQVSGGQRGGRATDEREGLARIYRDALAAGLTEEGARVAVAIAKTEGGLGGAEGDTDKGGSAGGFQLFFGGGMGNAYAKAQGITEAEARARLLKDPHSANNWALTGYLGAAIKQGLAQGLSGPALAEYAQRYGQRSVSPERAGKNYAALFAAPGSTSGQQRSLEANAPGESSTVVAQDRTSADLGSIGASGGGLDSLTAPSSTQTSGEAVTPADRATLTSIILAGQKEDAAREARDAGVRAQSVFDRLLGQFKETETASPWGRSQPSPATLGLPAFRLPGIGGG
jgi:hypothetical protein